jgi:predicted DNA-binding protein YlxM (UPF0122 family)
MLGNPFFMDYSIGEIARKNVDAVIRLYKSVVKRKTKPQKIEQKLQYYTEVVKCIGDKYIKGSLEEMLNEIKQQVTTSE